MKIISQTADEMTLKDGGASGIIIGTVLIIVGVIAGYHLYGSSGLSKAIWVPAIIAAFGLIAIFWSSSITVTINKSQKQIFFQRKRLLGSKLQTYNTQDALRVELRKQYQMQQTQASQQGSMALSEPVLMYQSVIVFKDGNELPLENQKSSSGSGIIGTAVLMAGSGKDLSIANQVATFLNVPFQEVGPGSTPMMLGL